MILDFLPEFSTIINSLLFEEYQRSLDPPQAGLFKTVVTGQMKGYSIIFWMIKPEVTSEPVGLDNSEPIVVDNNTNCMLS